MYNKSALLSAVSVKLPLNKALAAPSPAFLCALVVTVLQKRIALLVCTYILTHKTDFPFT